VHRIVRCQHRTIRCPQNRKAANQRILCPRPDRALFTVRCAPDSPVHPRTEGNQCLPNRALTAPRSLGAIKGTPRRMELNTKHPLNILQQRDSTNTQSFHCDRDLNTSLSCNSAVLFRVLFLVLYACLSAFRPRGVPGPTSKLSPCVLAQMVQRETEHKRGGEKQQRGNPRSSCCPTPRSGALAVGGLQASAWEREREPCASARSPVRPTSSYESPGPSFYRRKERAQVYNGGCSSVLTCLVERS
jgi:hypothetical protein